MDAAHCSLPRLLHLLWSDVYDDDVDVNGHLLPPDIQHLILLRLHQCQSAEGVATPDKVLLNQPQKTCAQQTDASVSGVFQKKF